MRAVIVEKAGPPSALLLKQIPKPTLSDTNNVLIKNMAFGLNRAELHAREGSAGSAIQFPRAIGIECVGIIQETTSTKFKVGQTVAAMMTGMGRKYNGSYQEYVCVPELACHLISKPETMSWKTLAALPEMYQTTNGSLSMGLELKSTDTLLVRGGTSSIGMCAIALAKQQFGIETVIATTRSEKSIEKVKLFGADHVVIDDGEIAEKVKAISGNGVDKVLEIVGTPTLKDSLKCCKSKGVVCMVGCLAGWNLPAIPDIYWFIPSTVKLTIYGGGSDDVETIDLQRFIDSVHNGSTQITIEAKDYELADLVEAHTDLENGKVHGKAVCVVKHVE